MTKYRRNGFSKEGSSSGVRCGRISRASRSLPTRSSSIEAKRSRSRKPCPFDFPPFLSYSIADTSTHSWCFASSCEVFRSVYICTHTHTDTHTLSLTMYVPTRDVSREALKLAIVPQGNVDKFFRPRTLAAWCLARGSTREERRNDSVQRCNCCSGETALRE